MSTFSQEEIAKEDFFVMNADSNTINFYYTLQDIKSEIYKIESITTNLSPF